MKNTSAALGAVLLSTLLIEACGGTLDVGTSQPCDAQCSADALLPKKPPVSESPSGVSSSGVSSSGGSSSGASSSGCTSNRACTARNGGDASICEVSSGECRRLASAECPYLIDDLALVENDSTIVVGAFANLPPTGALRDPGVLAYRLALREIEAVAGLPPAATGGRRPVVALLCDANDAHRTAALHHLVDELHVPAVIPSFTAPETAAVFQNTLLPAGVFMVDPNPTVMSLANVAGASALAWHSTGAADDLTPSYAPLLARAEAYARSRNPALGDLRVAVVYSDDPSDIAVASGFRTTLRFNGHTALENETAARYLSMQVPSLALHPGATYGTSIAQLVTFRPHVIISVTGAEMTASLLPGIETAWTSTNPSDALPFYLLGHRTPTQGIEQFIATRSGTETPENTRRRFVGVTFAGADDRTEHDLYVGRIRDAYGTATGAEWYDNYYDAMYWVVYAYAGVGAPASPRVRGTDLGRGIRRANDGPLAFRIGVASDVATSMTQLSLGSTGRLLDTLGSAGFDPATGVRHTKGNAYCFNSGPSGVHVATDTLVYRSGAGGGAGTLEASPYADRAFCFPGF